MTRTFRQVFLVRGILWEPDRHRKELRSAPGPLMIDSTRLRQLPSGGLDPPRP
jgi:hypothetical protein